MYFYEVKYIILFLINDLSSLGKSKLYFSIKLIKGQYNIYTHTENVGFLKKKKNGFTFDLKNCTDFSLYTINIQIFQILYLKYLTVC